MSRLTCKWKAKTFAKDDDLLLNIIIRAQKLLKCSPTFNGSNWQGRCSVNFSWQMSRCGARILMQLGLQEHHTSIIHLFLSFLSFFLYSHTRQQQLPALCIAAHLCIVLVVSSSSPIIVARRNFPSSLGCCCVYNTVAIHPSSHPSTAVVMLG